MKMERNFSRKIRNRAIIISVCLISLLTIFFAISKLSNVSQNQNEVKQNKEQYQNAEITLGCTGDVLIHSPILTSCYDGQNDSYNFDDIFMYLKPYVEDLDYSIANLECSLSTKQWGYSGYPQFKIPESIVDSLKNSGFKMFLTANNHSNDGGSRGILHTLETLKSKDMDFIGIKSDVNEKPYLVKDIKNIKLGMVNYSYGQISDEGVASLNGIPLSKDTSKLVNVFDYNRLDKFYDEISSMIKEMKNAGAEKIVLFIHWGNEYQIKESAEQKKIAQKMCDLGVDLIVGGHPHVIQPIEHFKSSDGKRNMVCLYSMGNCISNQMAERMDLKTGHTEDGMLFKVSFKKQDGKVDLSKIDVLPTWVNCRMKNNKKIYRVIPLDKSQNWKEKFNLSESELTKAEKSYSRTLNLVKSGLENFKS